MLLSQRSTLTLSMLVATLVVVSVSAARATNILDLAKTIKFNPLVPLTHCVRFGEEQHFQMEWSLNLAPKNSLEFRYTTDVDKGFSSLGFANQDAIQLLTGYPPEDLACARTLYDTSTVYDIDGNSYPNFPEVPAKEIWNDDYKVKHYIMRNLTVTAARALREGAVLPINVTVLWGYYMRSLYKGSCYGVNTETFTEYATFSIDLNDARYLSTGGACYNFSAQVKPYRFHRRLYPGDPMLRQEYKQNHRATVLLVGGGMLLATAEERPRFHGYVLAGEKANGVCSNSISQVYGQWDGFSDKVGGIVKYLVSVGTLAKPSLFYAQVDVGTNKAFSGPVEMNANVSYIVTVEAFNFAGLSTTIVSKPVTVLNAGNPVFGRMYAGAVAGTNVRFQRDNSKLDFVWTNWITAEHAAKDYDSGVYTENGYDYALGIVGGDIEAVIPFTHSAVWHNQQQLTGLSLYHGVTYCLTIRSRNCATQTTQQTSPGITIDMEPPAPGFVYIGNHSYRTNPSITRHNIVRASWTGFRDYLSGIDHYEWAVSTYRRPPSPSTNAFMLIPWAAVGLALEGIGARLSQVPGAGALPYGTKLYAHVKAVDKVGNYYIQTSNATTIVTL